VKVGINLRGLRPGKIGGQENYVREIIRWLPIVDPTLELVLYCSRHSASTFDESVVEVRCRTEEEIAALTPEALAEFDVWFCPLMALEPVKCPTPSVVSIPDLQHERFPEFFTPEELDWRRRAYGASMQRADAVITVSSFTMQQMVNHYPLAGPRIHVIPDAAPAPFDDELQISADQLREVCSRYGLSEPFVIYPANTWAHKNHRLLFEAIYLASQELGETPTLVLTGAAPAPVEEWRPVLDQFGVGDKVRWLGYVAPSDLAALLIEARALVFPSLYEGFGLPVLEAMRAGTPVVCSVAGSLPEVVGDAALFCDPTDPCSIARAIISVLTSSAERKRLVEAGRRRIMEFSWEKTARSTIDVLREVTRGGPGRPRLSYSSRPDVNDLRVGIVTPSLNQAPFIRSAIDSILSQTDEGVDHLVMDGGSTDGTVEILRSYGDRLRWVSEPDDGQSSAINRGLRMVEGDILTWVNSDDGLAPGAVKAARRAFSENQGAGLVYGRGGILDEYGRMVDAFVGFEPFSLWRLIHVLDFVLQPASFFSREAVADIGWIREDLHYAMDWDLWIRLAAAAPVVQVDQILGFSREYPSTKTSSGGWGRINELTSIAQEHAGQRWTPGTRLYALETLLQKLRRWLPVAAHDRAQRGIQRLQQISQTGIRVYADRWMGPDAPFLVPSRWSRGRMVFETRLEHPGTPYSIQVMSHDTEVGCVDVPKAGAHEIEFEVPDAGEETLVELRIRSTWESPPPPNDPRRLVLAPVTISEIRE